MFYYFKFNDVTSIVEEVVFIDSLCSVTLNWVTILGLATRGTVPEPLSHFNVIQSYWTDYRFAINLKLCDYFLYNAHSISKYLIDDIVTRGASCFMRTTT